MATGDDAGGRVQYAMHHLLTAWSEHDRRCALVRRREQLIT